MTAEDLAVLIAAYAKSLGVSAHQIGRERFRAAHKSMPWGRDVYAVWSEAKSLASGGESPSFPVEPQPVGHRIKGASTLIDADGKVRLQWIKTREDDREDEIARLMRELPASVTPRAEAVAAPRTASRSDLVAVYPLGDPHVGMLAWAKEGGADFDLEECERLMVGAMQDLVHRGPRTARAFVFNLGDFFHYDNSASRTTKGDHTLDTDSRAPKVLAVGLRIMVALIDAALGHHDHVTVDCRIGNHDSHTSLMLSLALGAYYRAEPRVSVPPTTSHRAYYEIGAVLLGVTHGDRARAKTWRA